MNQKVLCKRIMGLLFVFTFFSLLPIPVFAEKVKCEDYLTNIRYVTRYNLTFKPAESENHYTITMEPKSSDAELQRELRKVVFKVVKINDVVQNGSKTVSYEKPLTLPGIFADTGAGDKQMTVVLESSESNSDPNCTGKVTITLGLTKEGEEIISEETFPPIIDQFGRTDMMAIDCNSPKDTFETDFCNVKNSASKTFVMNGKNRFKDIFNASSTGADSEGNYLMKCDVNKFDTSSGYYVNRTSLYGYGTDNMSFGHYTYHYSPGVETKGGAISCDVKCEEAVLVEYGPPVASKAGLCFEYKVRVTSRVSCSLSKKPDVPETPGTYCTPTPFCYNSSSDTTTNQGGPDDDFDDCIASCDGGKYTDKCSKSCYKKIYGKSGSKKTSTLDLDYSVKKLADGSDPFSLATCISESAYHGCYYRTSGGGIDWQGVSSSTPGRWYLVSPHKDLSEYGVFGHGIYRHIWSDGSHCHDVCWWSGCGSSNVYLNPGVAAKDYERNKKKYEEAVASCKASASCTTTQATFTISVNYKDGKSNVHTLEFPLSLNKDVLTSRGDGAEIQDTSSSQYSTLLCSNLDENGNCLERGCYATGDAIKIYESEWSFPGSWINGKTGEISYEPKTGKVWHSVKEKFCVPFDAQDVNRKWWNYYQLHNPEFDVPNSSISDTEYQSKCQGEHAFVRVDSVRESDIADWNINAISNNFGYFGWNLHISCFYALNTYPSVITEGDVTEIPKECKSDSSYRVRTVDLTNLFPATDTDSRVDESGKSSRTPGFNWSKYAEKDDSKKVLNEENMYYAIEPSEYANTVQKLGESVYNDRYLDYSINLTKEVISKLKGKSAASYNQFNGDVTNGYVVNYHSPLFTNGGILSSNSLHPTDDSLKCNNMKNYNGGCEE